MLLRYFFYLWFGLMEVWFLLIKLLWFSRNLLFVYSLLLIEAFCPIFYCESLIFVINFGKSLFLIMIYHILESLIFLLLSLFARLIMCIIDARLSKILHFMARLYDSILLNKPRRLSKVWREWWIGFIWITLNGWRLRKFLGVNESVINLFLYKSLIRND